MQIGLQLPIIRADKKNRWNFGKANWQNYKEIIDQTLPRIPPFITIMIDLLESLNQLLKNQFLVDIETNIFPVGLKIVNSFTILSKALKTLKLGKNYSNLWMKTVKRLGKQK